jgi:hypothetical protein
MTDFRNDLEWSSFSKTVVKQLIVTGHLIDIPESIKSDDLLHNYKLITHFCVSLDDLYKQEEPRHNEKFQFDWWTNNTNSGDELTPDMRLDLVNRFVEYMYKHGIPVNVKLDKPQSVGALIKKYVDCNSVQSRINGKQVKIFVVN